MAGLEKSFMTFFLSSTYAPSPTFTLLTTTNIYIYINMHEWLFIVDWTFCQFELTFFVSVKDFPLNPSLQLIYHVHCFCVLWPHHSPPLFKSFMLNFVLDVSLQSSIYLGLIYLISRVSKRSSVGLQLFSEVMDLAFRCVWSYWLFHTSWMYVSLYCSVRLCSPPTDWLYRERWWWGWISVTWNSSRGA